MPKDAVTALVHMYVELQISLAGVERFSIERDIVDAVCETRWLKSEMSRQSAVDAKRQSQIVRRLRRSIRETATSYLGGLKRLYKNGTSQRLYEPAPGFPGDWQLSGAFKLSEASARRRSYMAKIEHLKAPLDAYTQVEMFLQQHPGASVGDARDKLFGT